MESAGAALSRRKFLASGAVPMRQPMQAKGKVEEVAAEIAAHHADLVIFNHELSPAQERNLERALSAVSLIAPV